MNNYKNIILISILTLTFGVGVGFAQQTTTTVTEKDFVEISIPMEKTYFLTYYGITENEEINTEIANLRKDFVSKLEIIKAEYEKNLEKSLQNQDLIIPSSTENEEKEIISESKIEPKKTSDSKTIQNKIPTKKVSLTDNTQILMAPALNISNTKIPYTETSTWFQKIRSLFKW